MCHRLVYQSSKGRKVEPRFACLVAKKLLLPRFGQRETQLVATNTLRLYLKARCARKIGGGDPELAGSRVGIPQCVNFGGSVIINHGGGNLFADSSQSKRQQKDASEKTCIHTGLHLRGQL